jgi:hypothetical protein
LKYGWPKPKPQTEKAFDRFMRDFGAKYPTATGVLIKDRVVLLSAVGTLPDVTQGSDDKTAAVKPQSIGIVKHRNIECLPGL